MIRHESADPLLMPEETVQFQGTMHWVAYAGTFLWLIFGTAIARRGETYFTVGGMFLLIGITMGILTFLKVRKALYLITDKRVLIRTGVIYQFSFALTFDEISDVQVEQGSLGMWFDYGSLVITGTKGTRDVFHRVASPETVRREIKKRLSPRGK